MEYRNLTDQEISSLLAQGCLSDDWDIIFVKEGFKTDNIRNVHFEGKVHLGIYDNNIQIMADLYKPCGLFNAFIQDCTIGDNVHISQVQNLVNYDIGDHAIIKNIGTLAVLGESTFGNGVEINVLNEAGGREIPLYTHTSAQLAYFMVTWRHDRHLIQKLLTLVYQEIKNTRSKRGHIGAHARIMNTSIIKNMNIDAFARIQNATHLENGTIVSEKQAPSFIGENVIAKNFICQTGSRIDGASIIRNCFIGQSVEIGSQFSAVDSLFFANCEGFHGEACSIFAGPYTVTHHKSTLLIAGMYSFYNAGSGTNQSNHMYKLGPVHQGILERGCKTGSFAYLLWPSHVGAFTAIMGKHANNFDTSVFPFSYINEIDGKSVVAPAMNLFTVGTMRDSKKWKTRDKRQSTHKLDILNLDMFNPYIISKVEKAIQILTNLSEKSSSNQEYVIYKGSHIKRLLLRTSRKYYELAIKIFIGNQLIHRFEQLTNVTSFSNLKTKLNSGKGHRVWLDIVGQVASRSSILSLLDQVRNETIKSVADFNEQLNQLNEQYTEKSWLFCLDLIERRSNVRCIDLSKQQLIGVLDDWKISLTKFNNMILKDAEKEFNITSQIGYGIDDPNETRTQDFENVRGIYHQNGFVAELKRELEQAQAKHEKWSRFITELH
jgi:acetyltransferase-like isoleucine patch superfamily enzyme